MYVFSSLTPPPPALASSHFSLALVSHRRVTKSAACCSKTEARWRSSSSRRDEVVEGFEGRDAPVHLELIRQSGKQTNAASGRGSAEGVTRRYYSTFWLPCCSLSPEDTTGGEQEATKDRSVLFSPLVLFRLSSELPITALISAQRVSQVGQELPGEA